MTKTDDVFNHLHQLIKKGKLLEVRAWLERGGAPDLRNKYGWSLLMLAAMHGRTDIVELLIEVGADPTVENKFGDTAKGLAQLKGFQRTAEAIERHENTRNKG